MVISINREIFFVSWFHWFSLQFLMVSGIFGNKSWNKGGFMRCEYKINWTHLRIRLDRSDARRRSRMSKRCQLFFCTSCIQPWVQDLFPNSCEYHQKSKKIIEVQAKKIKKYALFILKSCLSDVLDKNTDEKTEQSWCWSPALVIFWTKILYSSFY